MPLWTTGGTLLIAASLFVLTYPIAAQPDAGKPTKSQSPSERSSSSDPKNHERAFDRAAVLLLDKAPQATYFLTHHIYEDDGWSRQSDKYSRNAPVLLLGREGDRILGLTTACVTSFDYLNTYRLIDPTEDGPPEINFGAFMLRDTQLETCLGVWGVETECIPMESGVVGRNSFWDYLALLYPERYFRDATSHEARKSLMRATLTHPRIKVEPWGDNDLAFVSIPADPRLRTLGLTSPREIVDQIMRTPSFLKQLFGRDFNFVCEFCTQVVKTGGKRSDAPIVLDLLPFAALLIGIDIGGVQAIESGIKLGKRLYRALEQHLLQSRGQRQLLSVAETGARLKITQALFDSGDRLTVDGKKIRLAHIYSKHTSALRILIENAWRAGRTVLAIIEGRDYRGEEIAHLFVVETGEYLNLRMVENGDAEPYRHPECLRTKDLLHVMEAGKK